RYGTWRTESDDFHLRRPRVRVLVHDARPRDSLPVHVGRPGDRHCLPVHVGRPGDRHCLPVHASRPGDRDRFPVDHASSATFPFFLTTREFLVPVWDLLFDMFTRRYAFTRPEDLPRARVVWESTAQTNLRKSMWEARNKAMKTTDNRDPMAWLDYGPVWMRRDYWESLCERWATGPWQERSQAAKRNRSTHLEKNVHTSGSVSYATHNQKL
ncbi:hypothetical protein Taro_007689, partial [Colocasia esculenta]|nr:hypothetical protein [Colocasia esculenta]